MADMGSECGMAGDKSASGVVKAPPCTLVIFGAGGDLTKRLLMPALYNLSGSGLLADDFRVVGLDRSTLTTDTWRKAMSEAMQSFTQDPSAEFYTPHIDETIWQSVLNRMEYMTGDFTSDGAFAELGQRLKGSVVFYLAVAARFFGVVVEHLGRAGLLEQESQAEKGFRRVVIEKPFGADLPSARALNQQILRHANESQIYRIDHFLGKETVQSIMAMRFANGLFEPIWRREYIDHVQITAAETIGVEERGGFYEQTGALRDMVPNHLFTLLCMTAMEPPNSLDAEAVRNEKAKLIQAVRPVAPGDVVRGQYAAGKIADQPTPGYREEPHVAPESATETYIAMRLLIDNWRWEGVPVYLRTGKRLAGRYTEIAIQFKPAPYRLFQGTPTAYLEANVLRLLIDPLHGSTLEFNAKAPGPVMKISRVAAAFRYGEFFSEKPNVGYETLLYDCMLGDATLFQRADGIEASWAAVQPALEHAALIPVEPYAAGGEGPARAAQLLKRDGRSWTALAAEGGTSREAAPERRPSSPRCHRRA